MVYTSNSHEIYARKGHYHSPRQENACANDGSLITLLAIATVAMVAVTSAAYFGVFAVNSASLIGCYIETSVIGLALIVAIASRCIEASKHQADPNTRPLSSYDDMYEGMVKDYSDSSASPTRTLIRNYDMSVTITSEDGRTINIPYVEGMVEDYNYSPFTHCIVCDRGKFMHVIRLSEDKKIMKYRVETSPNFELLFSNRDNFQLPSLVYTN